MFISQVYMAREIRTGEIVALKKIRMDNEREGFPITAIREIKILKKLHHENVIKLKEIVTSPGPEKDEQGRPGKALICLNITADGNKYKGGIYMVFEYMDHDLTGLADRPGMRFSVAQIKLLTGLHYCHVNQVLHRDIKGSNLLIDNEGNLKLADFGLARSFSNDHNGNLTNRVITLWYRPPELLLGTTKYGPAVDMWSVGCIFAELLHGKPIFPGKDEATPDEINWPGVSKIPWYNNFKPTRPLKRRLREVFRHFDRHALELLEKMLTLDPSQVGLIEVSRVLSDLSLVLLLLPPQMISVITFASLMFQTKKKRQQQRQHDEAAKRQKIQHQQQHSRLPPPMQQQQSGQAAHAQMRPGPQNAPMHGAQPQLVAGGGPGHHYGKPRGGPSAGSSRYPQGGGNPSGGYNHHPSRGSGPYPPPQAYGRGSGGTSGYVVGPPNYSQGGGGGGSYSGGGGPGGGRGNAMGGNRGQQYNNWQQ
ncbi:Protein kinase, catalytic domain-containing protein [Cynara cardunculus var. scolymus]|uniref:Protein kinase, catalytic domain-containing protein n=1 Tax=Cynara cardunculus var. scolymus TaxID=59895 RepID=A0A103VNW1_CYNCS|nr:Protein kinase, catalytic domain-containing protein [Cynara cardunculus var. scolymus]